jgi:hypothetical protein
MSLKMIVDGLNHTYGFADVNHNGKLDVVGLADSMAGPFTVVYLSIFENDSGMTWSEIYKGSSDFFPNWVGDSDGDGLMEVFLRCPSCDPDLIELWESIDSTRLPLPPIDFQQQDSLGRIIWTYRDVSIAFGGEPQVADVDGDGRPEFLFIFIDTTTGNRYLDIIRNVADNSYESLQRVPLGVSEGGDFAVSDFDLDGKMEIAMGSVNGEFYIFEAVVPDSFGLATILSGTEANAYDGTLLRDGNQNGRDELVYGGPIPWRGYQEYAMYESTGDNQFEIVWRDSIYDFPLGDPILRAGDLDADGIEELVIYTEDANQILKWFPETGFRCVWRGLAFSGIQVFDTDGNGRAEIWCGGPTHVYEFDHLVSIDELQEPLPQEVRLYQNFPNPFNASTTITFFLAGATSVTTVVYDLLGNRIAVLAEGMYAPGIHQTHWNGETTAGNIAASGVYFYQLQAGSILKRKSMILLR